MELYFLHGAAAAGDMTGELARDVRLPCPGGAVEHHLALVVEELQCPRKEILGEVELIRERLQRCLRDGDTVQHPPRERLDPPRVTREVRIKELADPVVAGDRIGG